MIQPTATLDELRQREHWSHSSICQFLRICPAQFSFQRIHKLRPAFITESLPFGSAVHRTAEYLWYRRAEGRDVSPDGLADLFAQLWRREVDEIQNLQYRKGDFDSLLEQGRAMMRAYREGIGELGEVVGINVPFSVPLFDSDGVVLDRPVIGEFDLLLAGPGDAVVCVDLKTAAQRYSEAKVRSDLQPTVYLMAMEHLFPGRGHAFRYDVILKTRTPQLVHFAAERTPDDFTRLGDLVRLMERSIEAELFTPSDGSMFCAGCGYQDVCGRGDWLKGTCE